LRSKREAEGLSIPEMAEELEISRPYLTRLECGEKEHPSAVILSRIAKRLKVSASDLYALAGYMPAVELPSLAAYLRAKHPDWPKLVITEVDDYCDYLKHKYSLH
jgi:transcriptional regulator with XRE-family HTH domain